MRDVDRAYCWSPFGNRPQAPGQAERIELSERGIATSMRTRAERRWTVMLVPHDSGSPRAVEVSHSIVKSLLGIGGGVVLVMVVLGVAAIARGVNITRA